MRLFTTRVTYVQAILVIAGTVFAGLIYWDILGDVAEAYARRGEGRGERALARNPAARDERGQGALARGG